jgi:hypothetical protein
MNPFSIVIPIPIPSPSPLPIFGRGGGGSLRSLPGVDFALWILIWCACILVVLLTFASICASVEYFEKWSADRRTRRGQEVPHGEG